MLQLKNPITDESIDPDDLSSGEKLFLYFISAFIKIKDPINKKPSILLLDEPDATLHPEMIKTFIVLLKTHIREAQVNIIMTTHSPTTVALCEDNDNIFLINNKKIDDIVLKKITKEDAVQQLMVGITNVLLIKNMRQVFTESDYDAKYYKTIFQILKNHEFLPINSSLNFISSGTEQNGGDTGCCDRVKSLTQQLVKAGNTTVYGIIDWDLKNNDIPESQVYVIGHDSRYTKENYMYDHQFRNVSNG